MKLLILKSNLIETLGIIERAVPVNPNLPVLESVLIQAEQTRIIFNSTNLEMGIECSTSGKVLEKGEVAVPCRVLYDVVKNLNSEKVSLELKDNRLIVQTDNYEAALQCNDTKEFPTLPQVESKDQSLIIQSSLLSDSMSNVITATQYSEIRPEISGVYISITKDQVAFVATDGFRLAEKVVESSSIKTASEVGISCIIPLKTAAEVLRILSGDNSEEVEMIIESHQIHFISKSFRLVSRLTEGRFPEYSVIIPKDFQSKMKINRQEFLDAVKLVSSLSGKGHDITLKSENAGFLKLVSRDQARGENVYKVSVKTEGSEFSVIFNWRYLLDGLKIFKSEDLELCISNQGSDRPGPAIIRSEKEKRLLYVIMPIRG